MKPMELLHSQYLMNVRRVPLKNFFPKRNQFPIRLQIPPYNRKLKAEDMNREIKFRGRSLATGEWLYSFDLLRRQDWDGKKWSTRYFMQDGYSCNETPHSDNFHEVDVETVGEFIELQDKNDAEIYEGDIVKERYYPLGADEDIIEYYKIGVVVFPFFVQWKLDGTNVLDEAKKSDYHKTEVERHRHPMVGYDWIDTSGRFSKREVIGNIHQHPALITLEGEKV